MNTQTKTLLLSTIAVLLTTGLLFTIAPEQLETSNLLIEEETATTQTQNGLKCLARSTIIARGQDWVDKHVPYSQTGSHDGYRTDCSGFVSMSWLLSKPGLTTSTLHTVSHTIAKTDLQPGDAILCPGTHVVLFAGWNDSGETHYTGMEEANSSTGTVKRVIPYPYWSQTSCYTPTRYNSVC